MRDEPAVEGLRPPSASRGILEVFRRRHLLALIVRKEVQIRYRGSVFGWLWSYVKPLVQFLVFYIALGVFLALNRSIEYYAIYILAGITIVTFFNEALSNATRSLVDNAALIKKVYLPREMFPISSVLVALVNTIPQIIVVITIALFFGWAPGLSNIAALLLALAIIALLSTGLGMFFAAVNVSFRDAQSFVDIIVMCAVWASPVMYRWEMVSSQAPDWVFTLYSLNPITAAVELFHHGIWMPLDPEGAAAFPHMWMYAGVALGVAILVLLAGQFVFRRLEGHFAQDL